MRDLSTDRIAIVGGTGGLGFGLALRLGMAGLPIVIGSRDDARAKHAAASAGEQVPDGSFVGCTNDLAVEGAAAIFLTVPFASQGQTVPSVREHLRPGQVIIDTTVPLATAVGGRATRTIGVWQGSAAQQVAELAPDGAGVVGALHTVSASALSDLERDIDEDTIVCGAGEAKACAMRVLGLIPGLRVIDGGALENSRLTEY